MRATEGFHSFSASLTYQTVNYCLLGTGDEFVAEVPLGDDGGFRFFAAPGSWTLRVLAPGGLRAERPVEAGYGQVTKVDVAL